MTAKHGTGLGVYAGSSPVAPFSFDIAYSHHDKKIRWHISLGTKDFNKHTPSILSDGLGHSGRLNNRQTEKYLDRYLQTLPRRLNNSHLLKRKKRLLRICPVRLERIDRFCRRNRLAGRYGIRFAFRFVQDPVMVRRQNLFRTH